MQKLFSKIEAIDLKVRQVVQKIELLRKENKQIIEENTKLKKENSQYIENIKSLRREIDSLKQYKNQPSGKPSNYPDDKLKQEIAEYIGEIDACIELLNN